MTGELHARPDPLTDVTRGSTLVGVAKLVYAPNGKFGVHKTHPASSLALTLTGGGTSRSPQA